jgi:hypothetical protein
MQVICDYRNCPIQSHQYIARHIRISVFIDGNRGGGMRRVNNAYLVLSNVIPFKLKGEITTQHRNSTIKASQKDGKQAVS